MQSNNRTVSFVGVNVPQDATVEASNVLINADVLARHLDRSKTVKHKIQGYHFELQGTIRSSPGLEITFAMPMPWRNGRVYEWKRSNVKFQVNHDGTFALLAGVQMRRSQESKSQSGTLKAGDLDRIRRFAQWRGLDLLGYLANSSLELET